MLKLFRCHNIDCNDISLVSIAQMPILSFYFTVILTKLALQTILNKMDCNL